MPASMRLAWRCCARPPIRKPSSIASKGQRVRALENVPSQPEQLSAQELQRHLSPFAKGDPQYQPTREEQLEEVKKVTLADVRKFHDQFLRRFPR
jgi:zinc protease